VPKTAITTPFDLYEFVRMPFSLRRGSWTSFRWGLNFFFDYVDDLLIASYFTKPRSIAAVRWSSPEEHVRHLHLIFERLTAYGLRHALPRLPGALCKQQRH
jgi:hypothetical protein